MTASLGGLDALVFTGGVGEGGAKIRRRTAATSAYLGVRIEDSTNVGARPDLDISAPGATVRTLVVRAREDLEVVAGVEQVMASIGPVSTSRAR